jgi:hypothetical protein
MYVARLEVFTVMKTQGVVFLVVTLTVYITCHIPVSALHKGTVYRECCACSDMSLWKPHREWEDIVKLKENKIK